ncbi:hypothetical protein [Roseateles sp. LKC17W]|uniref:Tetratricopeptide repeat protein n=1 Tax=Pelomonas margarita TaxID=3299031 RepID=A0ABW7FI82_9BURK
MSPTQAPLPDEPQSPDADRARLAALMHLADPQQGAEPQQAAEAAREAVQLARQSGLEAEALSASVWRARHLYHLGQLDEALTCAGVALAEAYALAPALRGLKSKRSGTCSRARAIAASWNDGSGMSRRNWKPPAVRWRL